MTLENLAGIGKLKPHAATREEVAKLLAAAERNLRDARRRENSDGTRYICAYNAIVQSAQAALFANGWRPSTSEPGHHMTMVQALVHTIGIERNRVPVLDALRRKRHAVDYLGEDPEPAEADAAIGAAAALLADVRAWIAANRPELS